MKRSVPLVVLMSLTLVSPGLYALGLAEPDVKSSLSEPLQAQIGLTDIGAIDPEHLVVRLADSEVFAQAGMVRSALAESVHMAVSRIGDELKVVLTTDKPVQEPYIDLLLALEWPDGTLRRQVTLLLDPPGYASTASLIEGKPAQVEAGQSDTPSMSPPPEAMASRQPGAANPRQEHRLQVLPGDSLWGIAERLDRPAGISIEQLIVALYRTNPSAFPGGNMNSLRAGAVLDVPGSDALVGITAEDAHRQLANQYAAWQIDSVGASETPRPDDQPRLMLLSDAELEAETTLLSKSALKVASAVAGNAGIAGVSDVQALDGTSEVPDSLARMGEAILASLEENRQASQEALESVRAERDKLQQEMASLRADVAALRDLLAQATAINLGVDQPRSETVSEQAIAAPAVSAAVAASTNEVAASGRTEFKQEESEKGSQITFWQGIWRGMIDQMALIGGGVVMALGAAWFVIRRRRHGHEQGMDDQAYPFPSATRGLGEQVQHADEEREPVRADSAAVASGEGRQLHTVSEIIDEPLMDTQSLEVTALSGTSCPGDTEQTQEPEEASSDAIAESVEDVAEEVEKVVQSVERIIDYEPPSLDPAPTSQYDELRQPSVDYAEMGGGKELGSDTSSGFDESEWEIEEVAFEPLNLDNEQPAAGTPKTRSER